MEYTKYLILHKKTINSDTPYGIISDSQASRDKVITLLQNEDSNNTPIVVYELPIPQTPNTLNLKEYSATQSLKLPNLSKLLRKYNIFTVLYPVESDIQSNITPIQLNLLNVLRFPEILIQVFNSYNGADLFLKPYGNLTIIPLSRVHEILLKDKPIFKAEDINPQKLKPNLEPFTNKSEFFFDTLEGKYKPRKF